MGKQKSPLFLLLNTIIYILNRPFFILYRIKLPQSTIYSFKKTVPFEPFTTKLIHLVSFRLQKILPMFYNFSFVWILKILRYLPVYYIFSAHKYSYQTSFLMSGVPLVRRKERKKVTQLELNLTRSF